MSVHTKKLQTQETHLKEKICFLFLIMTLSINKFIKIKKQLTQLNDHFQLINILFRLGFLIQFSAITYCSDTSMALINPSIVPLIDHCTLWQYSKGGGHAVAQLVEALRYKLEGRRFDSRWCHWNFSLTYSFRPYYGPGDDSASNRNEYQEYFLGLKEAGA